MKEREENEATDTFFFELELKAKDASQSFFEDAISSRWQVV